MGVSSVTGTSKSSLTVFPHSEQPNLPSPIGTYSHVGRSMRSARAVYVSFSIS